MHLVVSGIDEPVGKVVGRYKRAGTTALREDEFAGRVWTKGYDKGYCFDEKSLRSRAAYVSGHRNG